MPDPIRIDRDPRGFAELVIDRPERHNTLSEETFEAIAMSCRELAGDDSIGAVIVRGEGEIFSAGADISAVETHADADAATAWMAHYPADAAIELFAMPQPTIAAINGAAAGGGLGVALCCDIRIVSPTGKFRAPWAQMGLIPDVGATKLLPELIGHGRALEMSLSGRVVGAEEALQIGLADRIADDPREAAVELAAHAASLPFEAARSTKEILRRSAGAPMETVMREYEAGTQGPLLADPAWAEHAAAWFARKRAG